MLLVEGGVSSQSHKRFEAVDTYLNRHLHWHPGTIASLNQEEVMVEPDKAKTNAQFVSVESSWGVRKSLDWRKRVLEDKSKRSVPVAKKDIHQGATLLALGRSIVSAPCGDGARLGGLRSTLRIACRS